MLTIDYRGRKPKYLIDDIETTHDELNKELVKRVWRTCPEIEELEDIGAELDEIKAELRAIDKEQLSYLAKS